MFASRYPETLRFAQENPLPATPEGMSLALLDVAALLVACRGSEADHWDRMSLDIILRRKANPYPGAFLSNPALLLSTATDAKKPDGSGASMGSYGAGCFFSYAHYQEDSLGPALLLSAFSPRTLRCARPARLYAKALDLLRAQGAIASAKARVSSRRPLADGGGDLELLASGKIPAASFDSVCFSMSLGREHRARLGHLRTDLAARAASLALSDGKQDLFTEATRGRLSALILERSARSEAESIMAHLPAKEQSPPARKRTHRV